MRMAETKYLIIHDEISNQNITCSYKDKNRTIKQLKEQLIKYFNINIMDVELKTEMSVDVNHFNYLDEIFEKNNNKKYLGLHLKYKKKNHLNYDYLNYKEKEFIKSGKLRIFIRSLNGENHECNINPNDNVEIIKQKVYLITGYKPDEQRLIFAGKQMEEGCLCQNYNLQSDSTIHFVLRLRGGMFLQITAGEDDYKKIMQNNCDINLDLCFIKADIIM